MEQISTIGNKHEMAIGWKKMQENLPLFFLMTLLIMLLEIPNDLVKDLDEHDVTIATVIAQILGFAYLFFLQSVFNYGIDLIFLRGIRDEKPEPKDVIVGFSNYLNIVLTHLLKFGMVLIAFLMLIIPGIIVGCRLAFVSYLVMDKNLSPIEAIEESWRMTKGHGLTIFLLYLSAIFILIAGFLMLIVGIIPALMWINSYFAVYYNMVLEENRPNDPTEVQETTE